MMNFYPARLPILVLWLLMVCVAPAWANGSITHLSGPVSVQRADGKTQPAGVGTEVNVGDTVVTGVGGYVRMQMTDGGEMVLRPDSQLKVESYRFVEATPAEDNFVFAVLRGGMRTITGLISKRGNRDAYKLQTPTSTVGIRGTQFDLRVCQANCGALADGTYLAVHFGAIQASNPQGSLAVAAGQVVHVPPQQPPVLLPRNPGIGFTPPQEIPKLNEKKKQAAAVAAAADTPNQAKPAASGSGQSTQTIQGSGKTEGAGSSTASKDRAAPAASEGDCSVQ